MQPTGTKRYLHELRELETLPPHIYAVPDDNNMFVIHVLFLYMPVDETAHPTAAPYGRGVYWFEIRVPRDYPIRPFTLVAHTPSARFGTEVSVCTSETHFQSGTTNPAISIGAFLTSLSFNMCDDSYIGSVGFTHFPAGTPKQTIIAQRRVAADGSMAYNMRSDAFRRIFPELTTDRAANEQWLARVKHLVVPEGETAAAPVVVDVEAAPTAAAVPNRKRPSHAPAASAAAAVPKRKRPSRVAAPVVVPAATPAAAAAAPAERIFNDLPRLPAAWLADPAGNAAAQPLFRACAVDPAVLPHRDSAVQASDYRLEYTDLRHQLTMQEEHMRRLNAQAAAMHARVLQRNIPVFPGATAPTEWPVRLYQHQQNIMPTLLELDRRGGGVLADPPGFGKTHMMCALLHATTAQDGDRRTVVIVKQRLMAHWKAVQSAFGIRTDRVHYTGAAGWYSMRMRGGIARVIVDEAHENATLLHKTRVAGITRWFVTASPTEFMTLPLEQVNWTVQLAEGGTLEVGTGPRVSSSEIIRAYCMVRRAPGDMHVALVPAHDVRVDTDVSVDERPLLDELAVRVTAAFANTIVAPFVRQQRAEAAILGVVHALITGDMREARRVIGVLPNRGHVGNVAERLLDNVPPPQMHNSIRDWLTIARHDGDGHAICQNCHEDGEDGVLFRECRHVLCCACFARFYAREGMPFCGLPCTRSILHDCYRMRVLNASLNPDAAGAEDTDVAVVEDTAVRADVGPATGTKMDMLFRIVRDATARAERVAIVLPTARTADAVRAALAQRSIAAAAITVSTKAETIGNIHARVQADTERVVLMQQSTVATGLNLQHFHHVVFAAPGLHPGDTRQLASRFVRIGATVPSVTYYHLIARDTFEGRLYEDARVGRRAERTDAHLLAMFAPATEGGA